MMMAIRNRSERALRELAHWGDESAIEELARRDSERGKRVEADMGKAMFAALQAALTRTTP